MSIFQALILGIVQGITEFLPISSSAHLIIIPEFFGWGTSPLVFDTSLHIGTALAVMIYFFKDFLKVDKKMLTYLIVGSFPVMLIGFLFDEFAEAFFRNILWTPVFLIIGSIIMLGAEWFLKKNKETKELDLKSATAMGIAQPIALFPGISRSGITISGGIFAGLTRENAAKFSFLLSTPAVVAAAGYKLLTTFSEVQVIGYLPFIVGIVTSFISGLIAIKFLLAFLKTKSLGIFIIYRILLALFLLVFFTF